MSSNTIAGRPIAGTISYYTGEKAQPQLSAEEFLSRLDHVLASGEIAAVAWNQYTPYFNDGEACEFHTGEIYFFPSDDLARQIDPDFQPTDEGFDHSEETWNGRGAISEYNTDWQALSGTTQAAIQYFLGSSRWVRDNGMTGFLAGNFDDVLLKHFGDPAEVTATKDGFTVEFYDHD